LSSPEFAYNTSVNKSTSRSPDEIVYGFRPRQLTDLIPIDDHYRASESASHVHELHKEISDKIAQNKRQL